MNEKNDEIPVNQFDFDAKQIFPDAATMRQRMPSKVPADLFNKSAVASSRPLWRG